jgi:hypothetical protein
MNNQCLGAGGLRLGASGHRFGLKARGALSADHRMSGGQIGRKGFRFRRHKPGES